ncbi:STAS domain-containing protein [Nocardia brasiliensis]|uniref:STAS domain-containing protein n=1 Tax=Nocardia brasiliensis TaxID=37326 RepID=UPI0036731B6C
MTVAALGGACVIRVAGEIDLATVPLLVKALRRTEQHDIDPVVLDLSNVDFLGMAGLNALLTAADQARTRNRRFAVVAATKPILMILHLTVAEETLACYPSLDAALHALEQPPRH